MPDGHWQPRDRLLRSVNAGHGVLGQAGGKCGDRPRPLVPEASVVPLQSLAEAGVPADPQATVDGIARAGARGVSTVPGQSPLASAGALHTKIIMTIVMHVFLSKI